jgi:Uncharacterized protein conserved in bacteria (DUF2330)
VRRIVSFVAVTIAALFAVAPAAGACGFLVSPNGAVDLERTTTLAAYFHGVEHYITSFEFSEVTASFGSIIPLPGRPTKVERAGDWTLQRLEREVQPPLGAGGTAALADAAPSRVAVISTTVIDSLTITVVEGGGRDVAKWANANGFALPKDTPRILEFYSRRSPFFALTKFDGHEALAKGLRNGDGIPVHFVIPRRNPWVPLRILAAAKDADEIVNADVFLLTDRKPTLLTGAGLVLARSGAATTQLLDDLRSDKHSAWIPKRAWLTYLRVDVPAGDLTYDLAIDTSTRHDPSVVDTGITTFREATQLRTLGPTAGAWAWGAFAVAAAVLVTLVGLGTFAIRRPAHAVARG